MSRRIGRDITIAQILIYEIRNGLCGILRGRRVPGTRSDSPEADEYAEYIRTHPLGRVAVRKCAQLNHVFLMYTTICALQTSEQMLHD